MGSECSIHREISDLSEMMKANKPLVMVYLAHMSYHSERYIKTSLRRSNAKLLRYYDVHCTQAIMLEIDGDIVISFRGTESKQMDWKTDLQFWKRRYNGALVHSGFAKAIEHVDKQILNDLKYFKQIMPDSKVYYTGHSLGAALATLLATSYHPTALYTFGSPRVGGGCRFNQHFKGLECYRYITRYDFVGNLPPFFLNFRHVGKKKVLGGKLKDVFKAHYSSEYFWQLKK